MTRVCALAVVVLIAGSAAVAAQTDHQHEQMTARGTRAMGFDQDAATHHFRVLDNGGAIEVTAKDGADKATRDQIRAHLTHIASMFAQGDFSAPILTHATTPPGADTMAKLKGEIAYKYEPIARGGRVRITTANREALAAVHEFLRFQIAEHRTGDKPGRF
jgi:hypothetical protein